MTVILRNSSAVSPEGSQHPTTSAHPSSSIIIRRMRSRNPKVHNRYFIPDGNLDLELEDGTVYRVHRHFFTQYSEDFASEYLSGPALSSFARLKGVEAQDLDRFLSLIYPTKIGESDISTADEWLSVLRLAERWAFVDLRKLAREKLNALALPAECDDIAPFPERAKVAGESGFTDWLERAPIGLHDASADRQPDKGLDGVDALDILQRVQASMRAMLDTGEGASSDVAGSTSNVEGSTSNVEGASLDVDGQPSDVGDVPASPNALLSSSVTREPSRITREPLSTTDLLRELPFDISTPHISFEPSLSNSFEVSIRDHHRESIQDRLQRVVGKEPLKRTPSLRSSFGRAFPDTPSSPPSPARSKDGPSSTEDHEQTQVSLAREPEERIACSDEERLARSGEERMARRGAERIARSGEERMAHSDEERVIGSGEDIPALVSENQARDDKEDRARRRQERMARYREEFIADLRAQVERTRESVERTRESVNRARETASRWMDIFGRTTYSSAFYGELMEENGVNEVCGADERVQIEYSCLGCGM
ncbi:hypothetical protein EV715DRAFT_209811 [Schizophyllum commune]